MGFTKLDEGILQSSIMAEDSDTFKIWIAILAACREDSIAQVSPIFLSSVCRIPIDTVLASIEKLSAPDPHSRSITEEGRRIIRIDGGFKVTNYEKYRGWTYSQTPEAVRQRRHRRDIDVTKGHAGVTSCDVSASASSSASGKGKSAEKGKPEPEVYEEIISHLNLKAGTKYRPRTEPTRELIRARLAEGFTVEDFKTVIDKKAKEWIGDQKMCKFLRPETLFCRSHFESYLNEIEAPAAPAGPRKPTTAEVLAEEEKYRRQLRGEKQP